MNTILNIYRLSMTSYEQMQLKSWSKGTIYG